MGAHCTSSDWCHCPLTLAELTALPDISRFDQVLYCIRCQCRLAIVACSVRRPSYQFYVHIFSNLLFSCSSTNLCRSRTAPICLPTLQRSERRTWAYRERLMDWKSEAFLVFAFESAIVHPCGVGPVPAQGGWIYCSGADIHMHLRARTAWRASPNGSLHYDWESLEKPAFYQLNLRAIGTIQNWSALTSFDTWKTFMPKASKDETIINNGEISVWKKYCKGEYVHLNLFFKFKKKENR